MPSNFMSLVKKKLKYINLTAQIRIRKWDASFTDEELPVAPGLVSPTSLPNLTAIWGGMTRRL